MSSKFERRLRKLETGSITMDRILACPIDAERKAGLCAAGEECRCRDMLYSHMRKTRGAGSFAIIAYDDRAI